MAGYVDPEPSDLPPPLTSAEIAVKVFRKPPGWFDRDRVRKRLYAKGFPHPYERGLWSAGAIRRWLDGAGANAAHAPPKAARTPRKGRRKTNGYAAVGERAH